MEVKHERGISIFLSHLVIIIIEYQLTLLIMSTIHQKLYKYFFVLHSKYIFYAGLHDKDKLQPAYTQRRRKTKCDECKKIGVDCKRVAIAIGASY